MNQLSYKPNYDFSQEWNQGLQRKYKKESVVPDYKLKISILMQYGVDSCVSRCLAQENMRKNGWCRRPDVRH